MKNKKADQLLGEHTINIIIAVLAILILIILAVGLYGIFLGDQAKAAQAKAELVQISERFEQVAGDKTARDYTLLTVQDWWMFTDEYGTQCGGKFCLCVFKD